MSSVLRISEVSEIAFDFWERNRSFILVVGGAVLAAFVVQAVGIYFKLREINILLLMLIVFGISYESLKKKFG